MSAEWSGLSRVATFEYKCSDIGAKQIFSDLKNSFYKIIINKGSDILFVEILNYVILTAYTNKEGAFVLVDGESFITNFLDTTEPIDAIIIIDYYDSFKYEVKTSTKTSGVTLTAGECYKNNIYSTTIKIAEANIQNAEFSSLAVDNIVIGNWNISGVDKDTLQISVSNTVISE